MRNDIGISHPNNYAINAFELLGWLKTCISEVLNDNPTEAALSGSRTSTLSLRFGFLPQSQYADRIYAEQKPAPGSNAPWRELLAASPDISVSAERPEDGQRMSPGIAHRSKMRASWEPRSAGFCASFQISRSEPARQVASR